MTDGPRARRNDSGAPSPAAPTSRVHRLPFAAPAAEPTTPAVCPRCQGKAYELFPDGEVSRARICSCQGPCTKCRGRGFELKTGEQGYVFHSPCVCQSLRKRLDRFNRAQIPSMYTFKDLDGFRTSDETQHALEVARTYARGFPFDQTGLLLVGPPGVGKTHLVAGILKILTLEKGIPCLFKDFFLLISEVRAAYDAGRFESEILRPLGEVDVLVVDELGKGRSNSDWEHSLLDEIICRRYNQMKTTLLTTNFPIDSSRDRPDEGGRRRTGAMPPGAIGNLSVQAAMPTLEERIGERIYSRLRQMCMILRVEGQDYRKTRGAASGGGPA